MKIALISPEFPFSAKVPVVPPILEYLGALTLREQPEARLSLHDANQQPVDAATLDADLVGISVWTATAPWAYRFADACRAAGKRVVLGGIHVSACPEEAMGHADAVVTGEAESTWGEVLEDARAGRLRPRYDGVQRPLDGLVTPLDAKLKGNYRFRAFFTMRGCPYACTFCSVHQFFGRSIRYRPVQEVAAEIEARAGRVWFNGDDNIWGADPDRAVALFDALAAGTSRAWYGFGDLRSVQGPQGERVLAAARRSGLYSVWAGWESDRADGLAAWGAAGKQGRDREEAIRRMQGHGLEVVLFMVLGSRHDDLDSYRRALELSDRLRVDVHPVLLTPLPGTPLWHEYQPHLVPGLGWEAFTGVRAVFEHPDPAMTPTVRERQYHELCRELFRPRRIARRLGAIAPSGFPVSHGLSLMKTLPMRHALGQARAAWEAEHPAPLPPVPALPPPPPLLAAGTRRRLGAAVSRAHTFAVGAWTSTLAGATLVAGEVDGAGAGLASEALHEVGHSLADLGWGAMSLAVATGGLRWGAAARARRRQRREGPAPGWRERAKPLALAAAYLGALAWQAVLAT